jgi:hypothetical protein
LKELPLTLREPQAKENRAPEVCACGRLSSFWEVEMIDVVVQVDDVFIEENREETSRWDLGKGLLWATWLSEFVRYLLIFLTVKKNEI